MFFTVNPPYKANIVFGSFLPHSYGSHITPTKKLLTLFLYFLQDQKELDFIIFIYLLQIKTNNLKSTQK